MERDKNQVEEEQRELFEIVSKYSPEREPLNFDDIQEIVSHIDDAGYRKIPEGAVALTKEELVKMMKSGYVYNTTSGDKINIIEMAREIERNETAKRIYEKAKKKMYVDNDDEGCYWGAIALDDLADICGVEVDE